MSESFSSVPEGEITPPVMDLTTLSDQALNERARQGDNFAFAELYGRHVPEVQSSGAFADPAVDSEDLAQIAALKALSAIRGKNPPQFTEQGAAGWFQTIARNTGHDIGRQHLRRPQISLDTILEERPSRETQLLADVSQVPVEDHVIGDFHVADLLDHIAPNLPEIREILEMRILEDMPYDDIANIIGVSAGAIRSRVCRALPRLKNYVQQSNEDAA